MKTKIEDVWMEERTAIATLWKEGWKTYAIAKVLKIKRPVIERVLDEMGPPMIRPNAKVIQEMSNRRLRFACLIDLLHDRYYKTGENAQFDVVAELKECLESDTLLESVIKCNKERVEELNRAITAEMDELEKGE